VYCVVLGGAVGGTTRTSSEFCQLATNVWTLIKFLEMAAWWRPTALSVVVQTQIN